MSSSDKQEESSIADLSWADIFEHEEQEEAAPTALTITVAASGDQRVIVAPSAPSAAPTILHRILARPCEKETFLTR